MKSVLFLALLFLAPFASMAALIKSVADGAWSNAETWEGGAGPAPGDSVLIRPGHRVVYDLESTVVLRAVHIGGTLTFSREKDTLLCAGLIRIAPGDECKEDGFNCHLPVEARQAAGECPALEVGTPDAPIPAERKAIIRLTYIEGMDKLSFPALVCCGGRMDLHGAPLERAWQKLGYATPIIGRRVFFQPKAPTWRNGDRVLFTGCGELGANNNEILPEDPRYPDNSGDSRSEVRTLLKREPFAFDPDSPHELWALDEPLKYSHDVFERFQAEAANLSRNVIVESANPKGERGHTMYHRGSRGSLSYVEFRHLGKKEILGRYPIHFHLIDDTMRGSSVVGCSIWDSANRAIVLHDAQYLVVRDNVAYDITGHAIFLEDGTETRNIIDRNLICFVHAAKPPHDQTLKFDMNLGSGFWWANSLNAFTRNVAVECDDAGYFYHAYRTKDGPPVAMVRDADGISRKRDLRTVPFIRFEDNEAHRGSFGLNMNGFQVAAWGDDDMQKQLKEIGAADGAEGVGPGYETPFVVRNFRVWDMFWGFHNDCMNVQVEGLDVFRSLHSLWRPLATGCSFRHTKFDAVQNEFDFFRWHPTDLAPPMAITYDGPNAKDTLPPSTIITSVTPLPGGQLLVRGSVAENERMKAVIVNGLSADSTRADFAEWKATIPAPADGRITARAEDAKGTVEPTPHVLAYPAKPSP